MDELGAEDRAAKVICALVFSPVAFAVTIPALMCRLTNAATLLA